MKKILSTYNQTDNNQNKKQKQEHKQKMNKQQIQQKIEQKRIENERRRQVEEQRRLEEDIELEKMRREVEEMERIELEKKEKYEKKCDEVNEKLRNILRTGSGDFKRKTFKVSVVKHTIVTAPTQVGKTNSIIELCKASEGWLSVISCDDRVDQMNQLYSRVKNNGINAYKLDTASIDKIAEHVSENENVVIVILNNKSQVYKLTCLLERVSMKTAFSNYLCIHDESDMIIKSDDITDMLNTKIAASHREWIKHFETVKSFKVPIRRIWVTATCENCSHLYDIEGKDIIVLPTPEEYRPINVHVPWNGDNKVLYKEIERIRGEKNGEVILYCYEKLIANQLQMAKDLSKERNCASIVYNSDGTVIFFGGKQIDFDQSIDDLLERIKRLPLPVVIFGSELMNRGLSFVGKGLDPLTATVMFYKAGLKTHVVGMAQKFGRITGTARPDLENRKIYCTQGAYEDYKGYLENQRAIYDVLEKYPELNMTEILEIVDSKKLHRPVDRPVLKKVNKEYSVSSGTDSMDSRDSRDSGVDLDLDKMKRLVSSWTKVGNTTDVAKLFRSMVENGGMLLNGRVKELLSHLAPQFYDNITQQRHSNKWNTVFTKDILRHYIRDEAMDYYETLDFQE